MNWTAEQILAFAPDAASADAGQTLAAVDRWQALGSNRQAVWGVFRGGGGNPYQTQIDLTGPAFRCSCPSRKFPCKHALGLFLLLGARAGAFSENSPPAWVAEWLEARARRAERRNAKGETADSAARARRAADREARVRTGLAELELWLFDLVRGGLASANTQPPQFWERTAARLVDAQAPGLARLVRELPGVASSGEGWQTRLLERMSRLYLLLEGYKRIGELPPEAQADIRALIGWTQSQAELLKNEGMRDNWLVLGQREEAEDRLRLQRTWLLGEKCNRFALLLQFAAGDQPFDQSLVPGSAVDAEVVFYPGAYPLRALIKEHNDRPAGFDRVCGYPNIGDAIAAHGAALARNPWIELFPIALQAAFPVLRDGPCFVRDAEGNLLRLDPKSAAYRSLLAMSGGRELALFGEYDGENLWPLSALAEGRFVYVG